MLTKKAYSSRCRGGKIAARKEAARRKKEKGAAIKRLQGSVHPENTTSQIRKILGAVEWCGPWLMLG